MDRSILFNDEMVRAILEGRKTQTRRTLKPQPESFGPGDWHWNGWRWQDHEGTTLKGPEEDCPFGQPGERLWVAEAHGYKVRSVGGTPHEQIAYRATDPDAVYCYDCSGTELPMTWRESVQMPQWASRITLEITGVRAERLQDISEKDALAEGINQISHGRDGYFFSATTTEANGHNLCYAADAFRDLWQSISSAESWEANPWVWVIEFRRVD